VSEYGRGNNDKPIVTPILIQFMHPSGWVVQKTKMNNIGESGTVGANEYHSEGRLGQLLRIEAGGGQTWGRQQGRLPEDVEAALDHKGEVLESVKVLKVEPLTVDLKGEQYYRVRTPRPLPRICSPGS